MKIALKNRFFWILATILTIAVLVFFWLSYSEIPRIAEYGNSMGSSLVFVELFLFQIKYAMIPQKSIFSVNTLKTYYHRKGKPERYLRFCYVMLGIFLLLALSATIDFVFGF
ncbi:MAG: hypothetical protein IKC69_03065 [Clostridia bacterium]|nr:hypothetical protein [Clostridia bacterium]MBR2615640.1 hypothetical protein [Clostridia bacterium]